MMLIDLLRDNLGLFLPKSRLVDSCLAEGQPTQGKQKEKNGLQRTESDAFQSVSTESCSTTSYGSDEESIEVQWHSPVGTKKTRPVLAPVAPPSNDYDDERDLPKLTTKGSRNLPTSSWYYSSNHIMVNHERRKQDIHPLTRKADLDATARWHAENMAAMNCLHHAVPEELQNKVGRPCRIIGKNVFRGATVRTIHSKMMHSPSDVRNMLDRRYIQFGMGTAKGKDGELFLCQVFIG